MDVEDDATVHEWVEKWLRNSLSSYKEWKAVYFNLLNAPHTWFPHMMQLMTLTVSAFGLMITSSVPRSVFNVGNSYSSFLILCPCFLHQICGLTRFTSLPSNVFKVDLYFSYIICVSVYRFKTMHFIAFYYNVIVCLSSSWNVEKGNPS